MVERLCIRILVAVALCLALLAFVLTPLPVDAQGDPDLPALAFEQVGLYRLEVALLVFYGDLLLVTPAFLGLARGRLPIEISTRGAKFAAEADGSAGRSETAIKKLEGTIRQLAQGLKDTRIEIDSLKELAESDSTQPEVNSNV
ncbi:MAG: hypothetical protein ACTHKT_08910 [Solirubrobacterales bacterium]